MADSFIRHFLLVKFENSYEKLPINVGLFTIGVNSFSAYISKKTMIYVIIYWKWKLVFSQNVFVVLKFEA